ncbi:hypothetical protein EVAR_73748_1 [Eumeta japonica]|uniref:Uncharacterized protein n=1 Tax=Eumeta variegata TaxID=151549 RepID=A0A4C1SB76_EUMVA|nr:hypothetical protein EVAR_73748_1 [Eumeta japonica]
MSKIRRGSAGSCTSTSYKENQKQKDSDVTSKSRKSSTDETAVTQKESVSLRKEQQLETIVEQEKNEAESKLGNQEKREENVQLKSDCAEKNTKWQLGKSKMMTCM